MLRALCSVLLCPLCSVLHAPCSMLLAPGSVLCALCSCSVLCAPCSVLRALCSVLRALCGTVLLSILRSVWPARRGTVLYLCTFEPQPRYTPPCRVVTEGFCRQNNELYNIFNTYTRMSTCEVFQRFPTLSKSSQIGLECIGEAAGAADNP